MSCQCLIYETCKSSSFYLTCSETIKYLLRKSHDPMTSVQPLESQHSEDVGRLWMCYLYFPLWQQWRCCWVVNYIPSYSPLTTVKMSLGCESLSLDSSLVTVKSMLGCDSGISFFPTVNSEDVVGVWILYLCISLRQQWIHFWVVNLLSLCSPLRTLKQLLGCEFVIFVFASYSIEGVGGFSRLTQSLFGGQCTDSALSPQHTHVLAPLYPTVFRDIKLYPTLEKCT